MLKLPSVVKAMLKKRGAITDKKLQASKKQLVATCKENDYQITPAVMAFEQAFGGMIMPDDGDKVIEDGPCWLFGTHACLTAGFHEHPTGDLDDVKLVPVVYSPNDIIYFLDEQGRGYGQDTIEDVNAVFYSDDATSLVCRIVFYDALFMRQNTSKDLLGLQGEKLAKKFSLKLVKAASGGDKRFFTDATGDMIVVEDPGANTTLFAPVTKVKL